MTTTTHKLVLTIALGMAVLGCKSTTETQPSSGTAIEQTEPLAFRIDGMRRINGAL